MTHALDFEPHAWQADANCATTDPDLFFPNKGEVSDNAKQVCANCDVQQQCLNYAITNHIAIGVFGGLAATDRRGLGVVAA